MLKNYIKLALRNIRNSKLFSFINVVGLSIGLAASFLMLLIVYHELSYDKYNEKLDRIARVITEKKEVAQDDSYKELMPNLSRQVQERDDNLPYYKESVKKSSFTIDDVPF